MTTPPPEEEQQHERQVPAYVALVRIIAVIGMSGSLALGFFMLLLGSTGAIILGLILMAFAVPFFVLMRLVEHTVEAPKPPGE